MNKSHPKIIKKQLKFLKISWKVFLNRKRDEEGSERKKGANYQNRRSERGEGEKRKEKKGKKKKVVAN